MRNPKENDENKGHERKPAHKDVIERVGRLPFSRPVLILLGKAQEFEKNGLIGSDSLFYAVMTMTDTSIQDFLESIGFSSKIYFDWMKTLSKSITASSQNDSPLFTEKGSRALLRAHEFSRADGVRQIRPHHVLKGVAEFDGIPLGLAGKMHKTTQEADFYDSIKFYVPQQHTKR